MRACHWRSLTWLVPTQTDPLHVCCVGSKHDWIREAKDKRHEPIPSSGHHPTGSGATSCLPSPLKSQTGNVCYGHERDWHWKRLDINLCFYTTDFHFLLSLWQPKTCIISSFSPSTWCVLYLAIIDSKAGVKYENELTATRDFCHSSLLNE